MLRDFVLRDVIDAVAFRACYFHKRQFLLKFEILGATAIGKIYLQLQIRIKKSRSHFREAGFLIWLNHLSSLVRIQGHFFSVLIYVTKKQANYQDDLTNGNDYY